MKKFEIGKTYKITREDEYELVFKCIDLVEETFTSKNGPYNYKTALFELQPESNIKSFRSPYLNKFLKEWYTFGQYNHIKVEKDCDDQEYCHISDFFNIVVE